VKALRTGGLGARSIVPIGRGGTLFTPGCSPTSHHREPSTNGPSTWSTSAVTQRRPWDASARRIAADRGSGLRIEVLTHRRAALPRLAIEGLMSKQRAFPSPLSLISAHLSVQYDRVRSGSLASELSALALDHVPDVLRTYSTACAPELSRSLS